MEIGQEHEDIDIGHVVSHDVPVLLGAEDLFVPDDNLDVENPEHGIAAPGGHHHKLTALLDHVFSRQDECYAARDKEEDKSDQGKYKFICYTHIFHQGFHIIKINAILKKSNYREPVMEIKSTEIKVRYAETDQMGVVHHAVYPIWFEACRTDFMEQLGYPYQRIEQEGFMTPLIKLDVNYKAGAKYGDTVLVDAKITELGLIKFTFSYTVRRKSDGLLLATGSTTLACCDKNLKIINLKTASPEVYAKLEAQLEK